MIARLARSGRSLPEPRYVEAAERAAPFLLQRVRRPDGRLYLRWRAGAAAIPGFVDDYAFLTHGLIELYQADFDAHWLDGAAALFARQRELFYDAGRGVYRRDDGSDPLVIAHHGESYDGVVPAARSITARTLATTIRTYPEAAPSE